MTITPHLRPGCYFPDANTLSWSPCWIKRKQRLLSWAGTYCTELADEETESQCDYLWQLVSVKARKELRCSKPQWMLFPLPHPLLLISLHKLHCAPAVGHNDQVGEWLVTQSTFNIKECHQTVRVIADFSLSALTWLGASINNISHSGCGILNINYHKNDGFLLFAKLCHKCFMCAK